MDIDIDININIDNFNTDASIVNSRLFVYIWLHTMNPKSGPRWSTGILQGPQEFEAALSSLV